MKHINNSACPKCLEIINRYPGFCQVVYQWFVKLQEEVPEAHVAWAGRNKVDQENFYRLKTSRAHYGQSAHNWNAAVDLFKLEYPAGAVWPKSWFAEKIGPRVLKESALCWYGAPGASFPELPHVELRQWRADAQSGLLQLVDGPADYNIP